MMYPDEPPEGQQQKATGVEVQLDGRELRGSGRSLFFCPGITVIMLCVLGLLAIGVFDTDGNMPHNPQHAGMSPPLTQYVDSFGEEGKVHEEGENDSGKKNEELEPSQYIKRERPHGVHSLNLGFDNRDSGYDPHGFSKTKKTVPNGRQQMSNDDRDPSVTSEMQSRRPPGDSVVATEAANGTEDRGPQYTPSGGYGLRGATSGKKYRAGVTSRTEAVSTHHIRGSVGGDRSSGVRVGGWESWVDQDDDVDFGPHHSAEGKRREEQWQSWEDHDDDVFEPPGDGAASEMGVRLEVLMP